jgi:hypothetical protein
LARYGPDFEFKLGIWAGRRAAKTAYTHNVTHNVTLARRKRLALDTVAAARRQALLPGRRPVDG